MPQKLATLNLLPARQTRLFPEINTNYQLIDRQLRKKKKKMEE